jgi:3-oxoacyl-[acyl-carrier-protein] synthase II
MIKTLTASRRVVVTGIGLISPVGIGTEESWRAIVAGQSGIGRITQFDASSYGCQIAGEVKNFHPEDFIEKRDIKKMGRFIQLAVAATEFAMNQSGLRISVDNANRVGVVIGSGIGAFEVIEREHLNLMTKGPGRVSPFFIPATLVNLAAGQVSIRWGARGPNSAVATACTTGAHAIGDSFRMIQRGDADAMICGGAEAVVTPLCIAGFVAMRAMSTRNSDPERASRPWDRGRDGFVVGEGAAILILEERDVAIARGATLLAEIVGYAANADAYHVASPREDGSGVYRVMQASLEDAGLEPSQIQYLNAHATSTPLGDRAEALAIHRLFGQSTEKFLVSSTKSMTGHLLGAAGALEAGFTVLAIRDQVAPPTINLDCTDIDLDLDFVPNVSRPHRIEYAMSNSFGFGGPNASLVFRGEN